MTVRENGGITGYQKKRGYMAKKYILELTQKELEFVRDGVEFLDPDNAKAQKLQAVLLEKIENTPAKKPTEIYCTVHGGVLVAVDTTDKEAKVTVLDFDGDAADEAQEIQSQIAKRAGKDLFTLTLSKLVSQKNRQKDVSMC